MAASPQFEVAAKPGLGWATIISPLLTMFILLCLSGIPSAEGDNQLRFMRTPAQAAAYATYRERTSPLIPLPPALYAHLPLALKRWVRCEWVRYEVSSPVAGYSAAAGEGASGASSEGPRATETTSLRKPLAPVA